MCSGQVHGTAASALLPTSKRWRRFEGKLANIDFVLSMVHPHKLPADRAPVAQFAAMLRGTSKPLVMVPEDAAHLEVFNEMAAACGAADSWAIYAMPTPPLVHGKESTTPSSAAPDSACRWSTLCLVAGATAPASAAGCVVLANAEVLSGLVITQLTNPGAPFIYGVARGDQPRLWPRRLLRPRRWP